MAGVVAVAARARAKAVAGEPGAGEAGGSGGEAREARAGTAGSVVVVHFFMVAVSWHFAHGVLPKRIDLCRLRAGPTLNDISLNIAEQPPSAAERGEWGREKGD